MVERPTNFLDQGNFNKIQIQIQIPLACVPRTKEAGVLCAFVVGGLVLLQLRLVGSGKAAVECALPLGFKRREHTQVDEGGVDFGCCPLVLLVTKVGCLQADVGTAGPSAVAPIAGRHLKGPAVVAHRAGAELPPS